MKILALEFSTFERSVAIVQRSGIAHANISSSEVVQTSERSTRAFELIEQALRLAQIEREQIECIAVGLGPGSYTGIRAAIALAQGWQLARRVKLVGISGSECLAAQALAEGIHGKVTFVIDAQRNEFYLVTFDITAEGVRETESLRLASFEEVQERQSGGNLLLGPEITKCFPSGRIMFPRAAMVGRQAMGSLNFVSGEQMQPIYLRETTFVKTTAAHRSP